MVKKFPIVLKHINFAPRNNGNIIAKALSSGVSQRMNY